MSNFVTCLNLQEINSFYHPDYFLFFVVNFSLSRGVRLLVSKDLPIEVSLVKLGFVLGVGIIDPSGGVVQTSVLEGVDPNSGHLTLRKLS